MTTTKPTPGEETLKAWVHWVLLNPLDDDQRMHAEATRALFDRIKELEEELKIQDQANEILTRQIEDVRTDHARLRGLMYPPTEISEWRQWAVCCSTEESANAADQAIAKCTQYFRAKIADLEGQLSARVELLYCGNCAAVEAREQRLRGAAAGLVRALEWFRDDTGIPVAENALAEWAQAALEKGRDK